jgi:D-serine deaminase-like pyridoxal phosphate-dependent protein
MSKPWYQVSNVAEIDSPSLLVFADRVQENVRRMVRYAGGTERLRPHVKTHKMAEVVRLQMSAGIDKFKCATIAEAEMVAHCEAADVMLAYPLLGPKIARFVELAQKYPRTRFSALADNEPAIRTLSQAAAAAGVVIEIALDIDNGLGRSGIAAGPEAERLYRIAADLPGIRPGGMHVYDGHIRDRELEQRIKTCNASFEPAAQLRQRLQAAGLPVPRVVAGGTPTFPVHALRPDVECSPGTCLFWDANYGGKFPDLEFLHAAVLLMRVISKPRTGRLCLDLGYKAVSADQPEPRVALFGIDDAKTIVHNEEHLTIETSHAEEFGVGDPLYGIPFHVCPTVALHQFGHVIREGRAVGRWNVVARDRKLTV